MRDRRQFIKVGGTTLALGVTGCVHRIQPDTQQEGGDQNRTDTEGNETTDAKEQGQQSEEQPEDEQQSQDGESGTEGEDEQPSPSFTVTGTSAPSSTQIGLEFDWSFTVENEGEADGTFETTVSRRKGDGTWQEIKEVRMDIPAGEESTHSGTDSVDFVDSYTYRIDEPDVRFSLQSEERRLGFEESYTNPDGVIISLDRTSLGRDIETTESYTYEQGGERKIHRASEDNQFALIEVEAKNPLREVIELPRKDEFIISVGGQDYETVEYLGDPYEGGEARTTRSGVLAFEISIEHDRTDTFEIFWVRRYPEGRVAAVWTTS